MKPTVKKAKDAGLQALAIVLGLSASKVAMMFATGKIPSWAVPMLGALGFLPHFMDSDDFLKTVGTAAIAAGGATALQNATAGKAGVIGTLNMYLPSLNATTVVAAPAAAPGTAGLRGPSDMLAQLVSGFGNVPAQYAMLVN